MSGSSNRSANVTDSTRGPNSVTQTARNVPSPAARNAERLRHDPPRNRAFARYRAAPAASVNSPTSVCQYSDSPPTTPAAAAHLTQLTPRTAQNRNANANGCRTGQHDGIVYASPSAAAAASSSVTASAAHGLPSQSGQHEVRRDEVRDRDQQHEQDVAFEERSQPAAAHDE